MSAEKLTLDFASEKDDAGLRALLSRMSMPGERQ